MKLVFEVKQGIIHVNSIRVLRATKDVVMIRTDFRQKYARCIGFDGTLQRILFGAGDGTLGIEDQSLNDTEIFVSGFHPSWLDPEDQSGLKFYAISYFIEMGRYYAKVVWVSKTEGRFMRNGYWDDSMK